MKPFITPDIFKNGKRLLPFQFEGINADFPWRFFESLKLVAYAMPVNHSFRASWLFRLIDKNRYCLDFSSACTQIVDWQEAGSLNIVLKIMHSDLSENADEGLLETAFTETSLMGAEKLVYEDEDLISECGLALLLRGGEEIIISAGISPGSVSVLAPFSDSSFEPQFSLAMCKRINLAS